MNYFTWFWFQNNLCLVSSAHYNHPQLSFRYKHLLLCGGYSCFLQEKDMGLAQFQISLSTGKLITLWEITLELKNTTYGHSWIYF